MNTSTQYAAAISFGLLFSAGVMAEPALKTAYQEDSAYVKLSVLQADLDLDNKQGVNTGKQELKLKATSFELSKSLSAQEGVTPLLNYRLLDVSQELDGVKKDDYIDMEFSAGIMKQAENGHHHLILGFYNITDNEGYQDSFGLNGRFYLGQSDSGKLQYNFDTELSYYMDEGQTIGGHELSAAIYSNLELHHQFNLTGLMSVTLEADSESEFYNNIESTPELMIAVRGLYNVVDNYFVGLSAEYSQQEKTFQETGELDIVSQLDTGIVRLMFSADF